MSGWRLGFGIMPEAMASHMTRLLNNSVTCTSKLAQIAGRAALEGPQDFVEKMREEFEDRRDLIVQGLNSIENVTCSKPSGAFYAFPNVREFGWTSRDIETYLLQKANVATLSGTAFGRLGEGYVRLSYTTGKDQIEKAIQQIDKALAKLPKLETFRQPYYAR
jgi:aspartate/methionine/tyrosine aminotransferase